MVVSNEQMIQKLGKISVKEKQGELLDLILKITEIQISDLDKKIKIIKPRPIEYELIDLFAEAIFSVRSFCFLAKDGLISSASAIMRILVEQIAIISIASQNDEKKENFLKIKKEKIEYYSGDSYYKASYEKKIKKEKNIKNKIKQYFDYGWCEQNGAPVLDLKTLCNIANLNEAYELIDEIINAFSHGQISIFKFARRKDGTDKLYIGHLFRLLGTMFFRLCKALMNEYGNDFYSKEEIKSVDMAFAISCNLDTYFFENTLKKIINSDQSQKAKNLDENIKLLNSLMFKLNYSSDIREHYLLSQAYIGYFRYIFFSFVHCNYSRHKKIEVNSLKMKEALLGYNLTTVEREFKNETGEDINQLAEYVDSRNNYWFFCSSDNYYIRCINSLLRVLQDITKNVE